METEKAIDVLKGNLKVSGGDLVEKVQVPAPAFAPLQKFPPKRSFQQHDVLIQGVFRLCIGEKTWTIDLANGTGEVIDGDAENVDPDATLTMTDDTFINLIKKKTLPQTVRVYPHALAVCMSRFQLLRCGPFAQRHTSLKHHILTCSSTTVTIKCMFLQAFVMRKLKIQGNITKALKVVHVLDAARKPASKL